MRRARTLKQLDDVCGFSLKESIVDNFYMAYTKIAEKVGIRLADLSDPDKCFSSRQAGTIFSLEYNSTDWSWSFSWKKAVKIISLLKLVIENKYVNIGDLKSLVGQLEFYHILHGQQWQS